MGKKRLKEQKKRREWAEWYTDACEYYKAHGDLLIPKAYVTCSGYKLGRWIERQRAIHNGISSVKGILTTTQIKLLEDIGMVWRLEMRYSTDEWMDAIKGYYEAHGDLKVPANYCEGGMHLGNWINEQRKKHIAGELDADFIKALESYGMIWSRTKYRSWDDWYEDAKRYYIEHGDLLVPYGYEVEGGNLFVWIDAQRGKYFGKRQKRGSLSAREIERLESIGMVWDLEAYRSQRWEEMYKEVSDYRRTNGRLPLSPAGVTSSFGKRMDYWITSQKEALKKGRYKNDRIEKLAEIGIN